MAKINTNGNTYTIIYSSILVIVVAFLLAFVAQVLKPTQDANVKNDVKNQILTALNIETDDVEATFGKIVKDKLLVDEDFTDYDGEFLTTYGQAIKDGELHVFVATLDDGSTKYVIPMTGRGLWGGLWGYVALNDDFSTVYGAYFSHESETAGLGALIAERPFQKRFIGKQLFNDDPESQEVMLTVVKSGKVQNPDNEVDGITGATLTTNGVAQMVKDGLQIYVNALLGNNK